LYIHRTKNRQFNQTTQSLISLLSSTLMAGENLPESNDILFFGLCSFSAVTWTLGTEFEDND